jgi:hypothetical protein
MSNNPYRDGSGDFTAPVNGEPFNERDHASCQDAAILNRAARICLDAFERLGPNPTQEQRTAVACALVDQLFFEGGLDAITKDVMAMRPGAAGNQEDAPEII